MRGKNRGVTPDRGPEGVPIKGPAKDAKEVEGRGGRQKEKLKPCLPGARSPVARSLALGAARQIATGGGEGGERRRRIERGRCHRCGLAISTPRDDNIAIYRRGRQSSLERHR